jgi:contact-dependent growth inhibition (CDI) system CdiI-like immunity protein
VFNIQLDPAPVHMDGSAFYKGTIVLGEHRERFLAAAFLWSPARYEEQWQSAASALTHGAQRSAFITSFVHPDASSNVIWPAWREGETIFLQNRLVLREQLAGVVDPDRVDALVGERRTINEDGEVLSEWQVPLADLVRFAA